MIPQVLQAINEAFTPQEVEEHLRETKGRVIGSVKVIGSATFDDLDDARRQQFLWKKLQQILGPQSLNVGPIILEPTNRG